MTHALDRPAPGLLWHVTVTLAGEAVPDTSIRSALERLAHDHPFLLSGRYASDRAEIRYWEEATDAHAATDLALSMWADHQESASLPPWQVVGVEVIDRETFHRRAARPIAGRSLIRAGGVSPL
jgi:hypothetical protein